MQQNKPRTVIFLTLALQSIVGVEPFNTKAQVNFGICMFEDHTAFVPTAAIVYGTNLQHENQSKLSLLKDKNLLSINLLL